MRKYLYVILSALLVFGFYLTTRAEQSPSTNDGKQYYGNQVLTNAYLNDSNSVGNGWLVVLDTSGTIGSSLGAYVTTTIGGTSDSIYVLGVTDEATTTGNTVVRVCIRGPHQVYTINTSETAGNILGSALPGGAQDYKTSDGIS